LTVQSILGHRQWTKRVTADDPFPMAEEFPVFDHPIASP